MLLPKIVLIESVIASFFQPACLLPTGFFEDSRQSLIPLTVHSGELLNPFQSIVRSFCGTFAGAMKSKPGLWLIMSRLYYWSHRALSQGGMLGGVSVLLPIVIFCLNLYVLLHQSTGVARDAI